MKKMIYFLHVAACVLASAAIASDTSKHSSTAALEWAKAINLPQFRLVDVEFYKATKQLREASKRYEPNHKGIQFIMDFRDSTKAKAAARTKITLDLKNVTLAEAAQHVCQQVDGFELISSGNGDVIVFQPKKTIP